MLSEFTLIRNVGRFDNVSNGANIPLEKLTIIYGENGRGKTTLSAILKSLGQNDPSLVLERRRLGAEHEPHIVINSTDGQHQFQHSVWDNQNNSIVVFDDNFVAKNVCSGVVIENSHCKNLHELIVGAQGVALNEALLAEIQKVDDHNKKLKTLAERIPITIRNGQNLDEFCAIENVNDIDQQIENAEKNIKAAQSAEQINRQEKLEQFNLPTFDVDFLDNILKASLPDLEAEAAARVNVHLASLGKNGEIWISEGIDKARNIVKAKGENNCPFCDQNLDNSNVVEHYQAYFSDAYNKLKERVTDAGKSINENFGGDIPAAYERAIAKINQVRNFWSNFIEVPEFEFDTARTVRALNAAREAVRAQLLAKHAAPFEVSELSEECLQLISEYEEIRSVHGVVFSQFSGINEKIDLVKEGSAVSELTALSDDLKRLNAIKVRHSEPINNHCDNYIAEVSAKKATEQARNAAREALNNYQDQVFPKYQRLINAYLTKFYAGYRLGNISKRNTSSGATCDYKVLINNNEISLTSANAEPSFKNSLSAGDRNTLALAFFFASLDLDPNLAEKIVIIDDPITSLDEHRSLTTRQEVRVLIDKVEQVVILSHEKRFLFGLWDASDRLNRTAISVERDGQASNISPWDVSADCVTEHDRRYKLVSDFLAAYDRNQERNVAIALRYILEAFIRVAYPIYFPPGSSLGRFHTACVNRLGQVDEIMPTDEVTELRQLLDYANRFHHDTNPAGYETERINDDELTGFARRVLTFIKKA